MLKKNNLNSDELKRLYFKNGIITHENLERSSDMLGDLFFNNDIHKVVKAQVKHSSSPVYLYQFAYDQGYSMFKLVNNLPHLKGNILLYLTNTKIYHTESVLPIIIIIIKR